MISNYYKFMEPIIYFIFFKIFKNVLFTFGTLTCARGYAPFNLFPSRERVQHPHWGRSSPSFPTRIGTLRRLIASSSQTTWEDNVSKKHAS